MHAGTARKFFFRIFKNEHAYKSNAYGIEIARMQCMPQVIFIIK